MKRKPKKRRTRRGSSLAGYLAGLAVLAAVLLAGHLRQSAPRFDARPSASAVATERPDAPDASRQSAPSQSAAAPARPTSAEAALRTAAGGAAEAAPSVLSRHEAWPELPRYTGLVDTADLLCHTLWTTLDGRPARNYTICFDRSKRGARWVAYPLVKAYTGSQKRPDRWAYDPAIDEEAQAALVDYSYPDRSFDRGHQIPNADRNRTAEMQMQTFYCSNSTPQTASLNGGGWARLEERIRRSWICADTLYVVTGAVWESDRTTPDRAGRECPVPDYYFKVLLRTRRGNIRTEGDRLGGYDASQLRTIGFWVRNAEEQGSFKEWTASVAEIERRTGFDFFPTIPAEVKRQHDKAEWGL